MVDTGKILTISSLLKKMGYIEEKKILEREYEIPLRIKMMQGGERAAVFHARGIPFPVTANLTDTKNKIFLMTGKESKEDIYRLLTQEPMSIDKAFSTKDLDSFYTQKKMYANELGALKYYEKDAGHYITSGIIIASTGNSYNASIHRMLVIDRNHLAARIVPRQLYRIIREHREKGEETPITILLGAHPLITLVSSTTPPMGVFELGLLPYFVNDKVSVVKSPIHGHPVPIGTSFIVEAYVTKEDTDEGPFVDAMGTYDRKRKEPVIRIEGTWVIRGEEPYFHAILPGGLEHSHLMGLPREAQIWSAVGKVVPKVHKVYLTPASGGWLHAVVSIEKNHEADGKNAIMASFAAHPSLKHVVIVDSDVDVENPREVEWAIATRFQADKDLILIKRARGSTLDPSAENGFTDKMGLDATKPIDAPYIFEKARIPGE
jgi:UbiD family decarboxylase